MADWRQLVTDLALRPHPEGGFYRETYRSPVTLTLPDGRVRSALTAIYFLLPPGTFSAWHQVASDESWHLYAGGPLLLHRLDAPSERLTAERPQAVVPAGGWQAAEPESGWALCGCTVAPGFDFADFRMPGAEELRRAFPAQEALIRRLTRT